MHVPLLSRGSELRIQIFQTWSIKKFSRTASIVEEVTAGRWLKTAKEFTRNYDGNNRGFGKVLD